MPIRQITIIGTGLIGGSFALALKKCGFKGKIVGCDQPAILREARRLRAIDQSVTDCFEACRGSQLILLATPVGRIIELIEHLPPHLEGDVLVTDVGSTKEEISLRAQKAFGRQAARRFLPGHPMAGKEQSGIRAADRELFRGAVWFLTPLPGQRIDSGMAREYLSWLRKMGARIEMVDAAEHDEICAWISHLPQMVSTALAAVLVEEYGERAPLAESGGRALAEMTRIAASPYSMWRDIALTNKTRLAHALTRLEQRLAYIREHLDRRELAEEFERAQRLKRLGRRTPVRQKSAASG
jgi:prephenate dehydrogenase